MEIKYKIVGDRVEEIREVTVHEFTIGDVDDPEIYAAQPIWEWQNTERGQWVMENAYEIPIYLRQEDFASMSFRYVIRAKFMGPALTEWLLRYGK